MAKVTAEPSVKSAVWLPGQRACAACNGTCGRQSEEQLMADVGFRAAAGTLNLILGDVGRLAGLWVRTETIWWPGCCGRRRQRQRPGSA